MARDAILEGSVVLEGEVVDAVMLLLTEPVMLLLLLLLLLPTTTAEVEFITGEIAVLEVTGTTILVTTTLEYGDGGSGGG